MRTPVLVDARLDEQVKASNVDLLVAKNVCSRGVQQRAFWPSRPSRLPPLPPPPTNLALSLQPHTARLASSLAPSPTLALQPHTHLAIRRAKGGRPGDMFEK